MVKLSSSLSLFGIGITVGAMLIGSAAAAETEPNGTRAQANTVALDASGQGSSSGKISPLSDLDFYRIVTPSFSGTATLTLTMTPTAPDHGLDAKIQLQDASGSLIAEKDAGFDNAPETLTFTTAVGNTTYFIVCRSADFFDAGAGDYTVQVTVTLPRPNLLPYQPSGWSDKIVVSRTTGTTTDSASPTTADTLYVDWAVANVGNAVATNGFYTELYVDGALSHSWFSSPPLNSNFYISVQDYAIGSLSIGTHTIKIVTDATGTVTESDETDNEYTKIINVADDDPNDQISGAVALGAMTQTRTNSGAIDSPTDVDIYSITVQAGQRISFDIDQTSAGFDSYIRLFDSTGAELAANNDGRGPGETNSLNSYLEYTFFTSGTYYLGVSGFGNANYNPITGTGDTTGSTGSYTLVVSPGLTGFIHRLGETTEYLVDILRYGPTPQAINSSQRTWIVTHGWNSSRTNGNIDAVANNLLQTRPGDQVLTLDWSSAADTGILNPFDAENSIQPVAQWAAAALTNYGFSGTNLNLVGHSFGSYVSDETAQRIPGGVNTIVTLDPAANIIGGYDPVSNDEVDFARDSQFSWSFHSSDLGNDITPLTADESFFVSDSGHSEVVFLFAYLLLHPNDPVGQYFLLNNLLAAIQGPWAANQYASPLPSDAPIQGYEAVIGTSGGGQIPQSIVFVTNAPNLIIASHANGAMVNTSSVLLTGTATDAGRGGSGIASVTVNGLPANNGSAVGTGTANWSSAVILNVGSNLLVVVARDNSTSQTPTTNSINVILVLPPQPPPALKIVASSASVMLLWPVVNSDFVLQYADTVSITNNWTDIATPLSIVGSNNVITLPKSQAKQFFRLKKPGS